MDRGKKACNGDRETCHKDHKSGFQRNIGNTAAQDPDLGKCKECYQQSVNTLGTRKKLKKQNLGKFVRIFCYNIILILLNIYIFCIFAEGVELFSSALKEFAEELYVL